jgi:hypothetical protein
MEQQIQQLGAAVAELQQRLAEAEARGAAAGQRAEPRVGVDTRSLGKPQAFDGSDARWRDWSVVFKSYATLVNPALTVAMREAEVSDTPALRELEPTEARRIAAADLYHLLLHLTTGPALDRVVNAGESEGLEAWRSLTMRYNPRLRSRAAGQLMELLKWDFSGEVMARIESFERAIATYQGAANEVLSDNLKIGIVLNRIADTELATHLVFHADRLNTWGLFRAEVVNIARARAVAAGTYPTLANPAGAAPMEVDAVTKGKGKGKGKSGEGETRSCFNCGRKGHLAKDCRQKDAGKDKEKDKNAGKSGDKKNVKCHKCGKTGHLARDCSSKAVNEVSAESGQQADQPEAEAAIGSLWITSVEVDGYESYHDERLQDACGECAEPEGPYDYEIMALDGRPDTITFGVDSGAAVTVVTEDEASDYPRLTYKDGPVLRDCQGNQVKNLGAKHLAIKSKTGVNFARVTVAKVKKNLLAVSSLVRTGHEVVFRPGSSYIKHIATGTTTVMKEANGVYEVEFELEPFSRAPAAPPRG